MQFARLIQRRGGRVVHEELTATWYQQNDIEVMKIVQDRVIFIRRMRSGKFWRMVRAGAWAHRDDYHSRGWYFWLGLADRDLNPRSLARLNDGEYIEDRLKWWKNRLEELAAAKRSEVSA